MRFALLKCLDNTIGDVALSLEPHQRLVGRGVGCHPTLPGTSRKPAFVVSCSCATAKVSLVSGHHLKLIVDSDGQLSCQDCSRHGTYVNKRRIKKVPSA